MAELLVYMAEDLIIVSSRPTLTPAQKCEHDQGANPYPKDSALKL